MNTKKPQQKKVAYAKNEPTIEFRPGISKTTLSYDRESMLCRFQMKKGAKLALHDHEQLQNGYIITGKIRFYYEDGSDFVVSPGDGYVFASWEKHGSEALEDVDFIEFFAPWRPEYIPE